MLGLDGLPFTDDDGLKPQAGSPLCGTGDGGLDIGAYACPGGNVNPRPDLPPEWPITSTTPTPTPPTTPTPTPTPTPPSGATTETGFLPFKNVFNPAKGDTLKVKFEMAKDGHVSMIIYDRAGRKVKTLMDENRTAGTDQSAPSWDGRNDQGSVVASGTYILILKAGDVKQTKKIVVLK